MVSSTQFGSVDKSRPQAACLQSLLHIKHHLLEVQEMAGKQQIFSKAAASSQRLVLPAACNSLKHSMTTGGVSREVGYVCAILWV